ITGTGSVPQFQLLLDRLRLAVGECDGVLPRRRELGLVAPLRALDPLVRLALEVPRHAVEPRRAGTGEAPPLGPGAVRHREAHALAGALVHGIGEVSAERKAPGGDGAVPPRPGRPAAQGGGG